MTPDLARLDPRAKRTRALLRDALMRLIIERQAYEPITIQDITDAADVNRSTFYLHFTDKDQLMFDTMRDMYIELVDRMRSEGEFVYNSQEDFFHVHEFAEFYRVMFGERGSPAFTNRVRKFLAQAIQEYLETSFAPPQFRFPVEFIAHYMAGAQMGAIMWWLNEAPHETPDVIGQRVAELCMYGLGWGVDMGETSVLPPPPPQDRP